LLPDTDDLKQSVQKQDQKVDTEGLITDLNNIVDKYKSHKSRPHTPVSPRSNSVSRHEMIERLRSTQSTLDLKPSHLATGAKSPAQSKQVSQYASRLQSRVPSRKPSLIDLNSANDTIT